MRFMATPPYDGALTEYVAWPADFVYPIPQHMSTRAAALCEPLSCGIQAVRTGGVGTGDDVLVTGDGPIGLFTVIAAKRAGATTVVVSGHHDKKLQAISGVGAEYTVNTNHEPLDAVVEEATDDRGVDVAIDCSGAESAITQAIDATTRGGSVVLYGLDPELAVSIDVIEHVVEEIDIRGVFRYSNTYPTAIEIIQDVDVDAIIDFEVPLSQTESAFDRVRDDDIVKGMISV
jgi:L-iditol 2-dehydrogenase